MQSLGKPMPLLTLMQQQKGIMVLLLAAAVALIWANSSFSHSYHALWHTPMVFDIAVAYRSDTDEVMEVMREVAEDLRSDDAFKDRILEPREIMGVDAFADSAVIIKARLKTKPVQQWSVGREYRRRLKKAFDEKGIEIPFPHRTITWSPSSEPAALPAGGS